MSWVSEHTNKSFKLSGTVWQNINFHELFFSGTNNKFSCQKNQELINTFKIVPDATMDVSAAEELVITIDDEVDVVCIFQSFSSVSFRSDSYIWELLFIFH